MDKVKQTNLAFQIQILQEQRRIFQLVSPIDTISMKINIIFEIPLTHSNHRKDLARRVDGVEPRESLGYILRERL